MTLEGLPKGLNAIGWRKALEHDWYVAPGQMRAAIQQGPTIGLVLVVAPDEDHEIAWIPNDNSYVVQLRLLTPIKIVAEFIPANATERENVFLALEQMQRFCKSITRSVYDLQPAQEQIAEVA